MAQFNIVIPCCNVAGYVGDCLDSVAQSLEQDYKIIAIDDCSADGTQEILKTYQRNDERITFVQNEKNLGAGGTRNQAFQFLDAPYTLFIDSDDTISPYLLNTVETNIEKYNADVCYYDYIRTAAGGSAGCVQKELSVLELTLPQERQYLFNEVTPWCKVFRTSFLKEKNLLFPTSANHEDMGQNIKTVAARIWGKISRRLPRRKK